MTSHSADKPFQSDHSAAQAAHDIEADAERMDAEAVAKHDADRREIAESQSEKFKRTARELGLDEREETFDAALTKVARHKPSEASPSISSEHVTRRSADSE